jgi:hypothetical protein
MESNISSSAMPEHGAGIGSPAPFDCNSEPETLEAVSGGNHREGNIYNNNDNTQQSIRRGRPRGSRNKPKENPVVCRESDDAMMPHVVQVEAGADIVQCLYRFYRSLQVGGLYVMSARGTVGDVTISMAGSVTHLRGTFQILSLWLLSPTLQFSIYNSGCL